MLLVAPATLPAGILDARVKVTEFVLAVVGVPVIGILTSLLLCLTAGLAVNPGGNPVTVKSEGAIDCAYAPPPLRVYEIYAVFSITACPTLRFANPTVDTVMTWAGCTAPAEILPAVETGVAACSMMIAKEQRGVPALFL